MTNGGDIFAVITKGEIKQLQQLVGTDKTLVMARDSNGVSALLTAAYYRKTDMVKYLRDHIAELDLFEAAALG